MKYELCFKIFDEYVKNYDLNIVEIKYKYEHTYRVVDYAKTICENENFSLEETDLTLICALLHDIARFEEWMKYKSWNKIDHGNLGYDILKQNNFIGLFVDDKEKQNIILKVVKYHNKYEIPDHLTDIEKKILKVVRDADKIDILVTQTNKNNFEKKCREDWVDVEKVILDKNIMDTILNEELIKSKLVNNVVLLLLKQLTFLFDIEYRTSFKLIYNLDIVNNKLKALKEMIDDDKQYKILEIKFKDYLESHIKL